MLTMIERTARPDGGHRVHSQSHRKGNWLGEGWLEVPQHLEPEVWACCGYCDLTVEDGTLTGIVPRERPEPEGEETLSAEEVTALLEEMSGGEEDV